MLTYDKIITTMQDPQCPHPQLAQLALHTDTKVVGLSLTQVAFFLEKISNLIFLSRFDYGLGYAIYKFLKFVIQCKPMITNDR